MGLSNGLAIEFGQRNVNMQLRIGHPFLPFGQETGLGILTLRRHR